MTLTAKQENFAQAVAHGANNTDAYRQCYNVAPRTTPAAVTVNACKLRATANVSLRIDELRASEQAVLAVRRAWDNERLTDEAETNLKGARSDDQWGPANNALTFIGKVTGLVTDGKGVTINTGDTYNHNELNVIVTGLPKVLEPYPEAKEAVIRWLETLEGSDEMLQLPTGPDDEKRNEETA